jgi:hypothetical protein
LRDKFDHFVANETSGGDNADDRIAEFGSGTLRLCQFVPGDARFMADCKACAVKAGLQVIVTEATPFYVGSSSVYQSTPYYNPAPVKTVPMRANFGCDWPYAARRYNGSGVNSYWYQSLVLNHLLQQ